MTDQQRKTGGSNDYYVVEIKNTIDGRPPFTAQCLEVIEALGMTFAEGEAFKAIWRTCAARTLGKEKPGNTALYDAEKVQFYGGRMVAACVPAPALTAGDHREEDIQKLMQGPSMDGPRAKEAMREVLAGPRPIGATHWHSAYQRWISDDGATGCWEWFDGKWQSISKEAMSPRWLNDLRQLPFVAPPPGRDSHD